MGSPMTRLKIICTVKGGDGANEYMRKLLLAVVDVVISSAVNCVLDYYNNKKNR